MVGSRPGRRLGSNRPLEQRAVQPAFLLGAVLPLAHGVSAREFTVPANGEAEFDMIVTANAATALIRILGSDRKSREAIEYRLKGKLSTRLGLLRSIPFEESGTLPIGSLTGKSRKAD